MVPNREHDWDYLKPSRYGTKEEVGWFVAEDAIPASAHITRPGLYDLFAGLVLLRRGSKDFTDPDGNQFR